MYLLLQEVHVILCLVPVVILNSPSLPYAQPFSAKGHEHKSVSTHTVSFWVWVSMVNAAGRTFYNDLYDPEAYSGCVLCTQVLKGWPVFTVTIR